MAIQGNSAMVPARQKRVLVPTLIALAIGLTASIAIWICALQSVHRLEQQKFDALAARVGRIVPYRMNLYLYGLRSARGVFIASKAVDRDEWRRYVSSRDLPNEFPGAFGFGFIQRVGRDELQ